MATANGTLMRVRPQGAVINCEVTSTFSTQFSVDKVACKDTPNGEVKPGPIDFSLSGEALVELGGAGNGCKSMLTLHHDKTLFACDYVVSEAGGFTISAPETLLTQMDVTGGTEEIGRFNFTITGSGDYTIT